MSKSIVMEILRDRCDEIIAQPVSQRLIEIKEPHTKRKYTQFNLCGKRELSAYPYRDGYILTPVSGEDCAFEVSQGAFKGLDTELASWSLYALDGNSVTASSFYLAPSKPSEVFSRSVRSQGWGGIKATGFVGRNQRILVSPAAFWLFTGVVANQYEPSMGHWEWEINSNSYECIAKLRFVSRSTSKRRVGADKKESEHKTIRVQPQKSSYFYLPTEFFVSAGRPLNQTLPTKIDFERNEIVFEAPIETCELCGKPLRSRYGEIHRVQACQCCAFTLDEVKAMSNRYQEDTVETLTRALNEVSGNLEKYIETVKNFITFADSL